MKNTHQNSSFTGKKLLTLSLAALLSSGSMYSVFAAAPAAQKPVTSSHLMKASHKENANPNYSGWDEPAMKYVAVHSGKALLRHLSAAHQALTEKNISSAKASLTAAQDFAVSLKKMIPFTRISEEIKDSKGNILQIKYGYLLDDMLPVYENLEQLDLYAPELKSRVATRKTPENKTSAAHVEELFEAEDTTVYLPVLHVSSLIDNALAALDRKNADINTAKVAVEKALNSLTGIITSTNVLQTQSSGNKNSDSAKPVSPMIRAELIRAKQSIAFAENLQKEARHDPQYIYSSIKDALTIVDKLLSSGTVSTDTRSKLEAIKKGIEKINADVNNTAAYAEVRSLLEPLTDNPGE